MPCYRRRLTGASELAFLVDEGDPGRRAGRGLDRVKAGDQLDVAPHHLLQLGELGLAVELHHFALAAGGEDCQLTSPIATSPLCGDGRWDRARRRDAGSITTP